jgi:predicted dehydrogenase
MGSTPVPLRLAVIGAGGIAQGIHLLALRCLGDLGAVVAVCDVVEDRARKAATALGIPSVYGLYPEMLQRETLDAVFVLTEPDRLFRPALECLAAGKHVFMEKPPGVRTMQFIDLLRAHRI